MVIAVRTESEGPDGPLVVVKEARTDGDVARLGHEASMLTRARHPGVVDLVAVEDRAIRLRHAGTALARLGPLPADQAAAVVSAVADVVHAVHRQGVVHGDVDADHVVLDARGRPRLCGFGQARDLTRDGTADDVAALGRLLRDLLAAGRHLPWAAPPPGLRSRSVRARALRDLDALVAQATGPGPRPTARQLAKAIHVAVPSATLPDPDRLRTPPPPAAAPAVIPDDVDPTEDLAWSPEELSWLATAPDDAWPGDGWAGDEPGGATDDAEPGDAEPDDEEPEGDEPEGDASAAVTTADGALVEDGWPDGDRVDGGGSEGHRVDERTSGEDPDPAAAPAPVPAAAGPGAPTASEADPGPDHRGALDALPDEAIGWHLPDLDDDGWDRAEEPAPTPARITLAASAEPPPPPAPTVTLPESRLADGDERAWPRAVARGAALVALLVVGVAGGVAGARALRPADAPSAGTTTAPADADAGTDAPGTSDPDAAAGDPATDPGTGDPDPGTGDPDRDADDDADADDRGDANAGGGSATPPTWPDRCDLPDPTGPDVDGDGCPEAIELDGRTAVVGPASVTLGEDGDLVALGDWDCDGVATPGLLRPDTGEVFLFPRWSFEEVLEVDATEVVPGATSLRAAPGACPALLVGTPDGDVAVRP